MPAEHCIKGALRDTRSSPKNPRNLKVTIVIILLGGVAVLATSPISSYARIIRAACSAKASASIEDEEPTNTNPEEIPKTPERGRGWVRTRDVNNPRIHNLKKLLINRDVTISLNTNNITIMIFR